MDFVASPIGATYQWGHGLHPETRPQERSKERPFVTSGIHSPLALRASWSISRGVSKGKSCITTRSGSGTILGEAY